MGEVKQWYIDTHGVQGSGRIPDEWSWNDFFRALCDGKGQTPVLSKRTQEKCIRKLSEILRTSDSTLIEMTRR